VSNVLLDEHGRLTGVIDWNNGAFRGDRRFALVKLLFDLTWEATAPSGGRHHVQPSALTRLEQILYETVEAPLLRAYWAHWTLTMLGWTIRSGDAEVIDLHLRLGERGLH
jgi:aminoglycoside phosphotransferase (APT) family kinase protein